MGLVLCFLFGECRHIGGEMAAEDHQEGPDIADHIGNEVGPEHGQRYPPRCEGYERQREDGECHVVLEQLPPDLAHGSASAGGSCSRTTWHSPSDRKSTRLNSSHVAI